jgi:hypothetical protein
MREILGPEAGARLKPIWGLDSEGEIQGAWRDIGLPNLWCMIGKPFSFSGGEKKLRCSTRCREFCLVPIPLEARCAAYVSL